MAYQRSTREILQDIYDRFELGSLREEADSSEWTYSDGMDQLRLFSRGFVDGMKRADDYALSKYTPKEAQFIKSKYASIFRTLADLFEGDSTQPFNSALADEISDSIVRDYLKEIHGVDLSTPKNTES